MVFPWQNIWGFDVYDGHPGMVLGKSSSLASLRIPTINGCSDGKVPSGCHLSDIVLFGKVGILFSASLVCIASTSSTTSNSHPKFEEFFITIAFCWAQGSMWRNLLMTTFLPTWGGEKKKKKSALRQVGCLNMDGIAQKHLITPTSDSPTLVSISHPIIVVCNTPHFAALWESKNEFQWCWANLLRLLLFHKLPSLMKDIAFRCSRLIVSVLLITVARGQRNILWSRSGTLVKSL